MNSILDVDYSEVDEFVQNNSDFDVVTAFHNAHQQGQFEEQLSQKELATLRRTMVQLDDAYFLSCVQILCDYKNDYANFVSMGWSYMMGDGGGGFIKNIPVKVYDDEGNELYADIHSHFEDAGYSFGGQGDDYESEKAADAVLEAVEKFGSDYYEEFYGATFAQTEDFHEKMYGISDDTERCTKATEKMEEILKQFGWDVEISSGEEKINEIRGSK